MTRIEIVNPIKWFSIRRNEVGAVTKNTPIIATEKRQQRNALMLRDVCYRIYARMVFIPPRSRKGESGHPAGADENPAKYQAMFERRASKGQCFTQPYLGTRECSAFFKLLPDEARNGADLLPESRDLGFMLYDIDFESNDLTPMFFRAKMEQGVINVPDKNSEEVLR